MRKTYHLLDWLKLVAAGVLAFGLTRTQVMLGCSEKGTLTSFRPDSNSRTIAMIQLSPAAANEIVRLKSKTQNPASKLRITLLPSHCLDLAYAMSLDSAQQPGDQVYDGAQIQIVVHRDVIPYLEGLFVDYSEDLMGGGFRFHNPKASQSCSCGNSFAVAQ